MKQSSNMARWLAALSIVGLLAAGCRSDDKDTATKTTTDSGSDSTDTSDTSGEDAPSGDLIGQDSLDLCADYQPTAGISGDTIKVGTIRPAVGSFSIYKPIAEGIEKHFESVNAAGGVKAGDGKTYKLELVAGDDEYDPTKTPNEMKRLVEEEGVFAIVGEVGTEHNLAVRDYLNEKCVPSVAIASGALAFGDVVNYPWQMSGIPSYAAEAHLFAEFIKEKQPGAKVAVAYQNDLVGKSYLATLEKDAEEFGFSVVAKESYDPLGGGAPTAQVTSLASSGADAFFIAMSGAPCAQAISAKPADWKPLTFASITCAGKVAMQIAGPAQEGLYVAQATYDPGAPSDDAVPAMVQFKADAAAVGVSKDSIESGVLAIGWGLGAEFTAALAKMETVDRASLINTMNNFGTIEGIGIQRYPAQTGPGDPWIIEQMRVVQRQNGDWVEARPVEDFNGKSDSFRGKE